MIFLVVLPQTAFSPKHLYVLPLGTGLTIVLEYQGRNNLYDRTGQGFADGPGVASGASKQMRKLTLSRKRGQEALVDFYLIAGDEFVGFVGHADDGLELLEHGSGHSFAEGGSGVRGDTVGAVVSDADGDVNQFLSQRIEGARPHDLLEAFPGALEQRRIVRDGLPEVVNPIDLACGHDVVVDGAHFRRRVLVFDRCEGGHESLPNYRCAHRQRR